MEKKWPDEIIVDNAAPPPFATALVRANLPEWCGEMLTAMRELEKRAAV